MMLLGSVGQEFNWSTVRVTCLCFSKTEYSVGKTQKSGEHYGRYQNHLETSLLTSWVLMRWLEGWAPTCSFTRMGLQGSGSTSMVAQGCITFCDRTSQRSLPWCPVGQDHHEPAHLQSKETQSPSINGRISKNLLANFLNPEQVA